MSVPPRPQKLGTIVDIRGDGTWSPMADQIISTVIAPFLQVSWKQIDLSLQGRDQTDDKVVQNIITALNEHKAGVKGPTITPTAEEAKQLGLKQTYASPNGAIRKGIDGVAITRAPIVIEGITRLPENTGMLRKAVGDIYGATNMRTPSGGTIKLLFTAANGETTVLGETKVKGPTVGILETNEEADIKEYARYAFAHALQTGKKHVILGHKNTISKVHDGAFVEIFKSVFEEEDKAGQSFKKTFAEKGMTYSAQLIDAVAELQVTDKLKPHTLIALKNYDGDVQSDTMGGMCGSLALVTSELESAKGVVMADPPHGTANVFNKDWKERGVLRANPAAYIFAYARAIEHKGRLENNPYAVSFAGELKKATVKSIQDGLGEGKATADIILLEKFKQHKEITTQELMARIARNIPPHYRLAAAKTRNLTASRNTPSQG